jgi:hypothetical protein
MKPVVFSKEVPILVVDDLYDELELSTIWEELQFLTSPRRMHNSFYLGAAKNESGAFKKNANGVFLDELYAERSSSNILEVNRKLFTKEIQDMALQVSIFYKLLERVNNDYTLINYYEDAQSYAAHYDETVFSAITMLYKEPVQFSGGDLDFPELELTVEKRNNRMVLFPGALLHAATPVVMHEKHASFSGYGRYSMVQFLRII